MASVPVSNPGSPGPNSAALSTAQTGNGQSTNVADRGGSTAPALLTIVTTVGATPTCTYAVEGSADGTDWFPVAIADAATPETVSVATFAVHNGDHDPQDPALRTPVAVPSGHLQRQHQRHQHRDPVRVLRRGSMADDRMIAALLRERAGLVSLGKTKRVEQVDEQLKLYGYKPDGAKAEASDDGKTAARKQPPQGRSTRPQQTGDKSD